MANKKISDLPLATTIATTDLIEIETSADGVSKKAPRSLLGTHGATKVYIAKIAQVGISAPYVLLTKINTLGETPTFTYSGVGHYIIHSPGSLFTQYAIPSVQGPYQNTPTNNISIDRTDDSQIEIFTVHNGSSSDNVMGNDGLWVTIEI